MAWSRRWILKIDALTHLSNDDKMKCVLYFANFNEYYIVYAIIAIKPFHGVLTLPGPSRDFEKPWALPSVVNISTSPRPLKKPPKKT